MFIKQFWIDATERALATAAQVAIVAIGGQSADKVVEGWSVVLGAALLGAVLSILKSIVASQTGDSNTASLVGTKLGDR